MEQRKILVVDDDEAVRAVTAEMLVRLGYSVTLADSGERALEETAQQDFQVVLLDHAMPSMSGLDVYLAMRDQDVTARIIFMTGFSRDEFRDLLDAGADISVLSKPFPMQELKDAVEGVLVET